jgi:hypothetical protein
VLEHRQNQDIRLITWDVITGKKISGIAFDNRDRMENELKKFKRFNFRVKNSDSNLSGLYDKALVVDDEPITDQDGFESILTRYYDP